MVVMEASTGDVSEKVAIGTRLFALPFIIRDF